MFADGLPATYTDIINAPVIKAEYITMQGDSPIDVTDSVYTVCLYTEGNEFVFKDKAIIYQFSSGRTKMMFTKSKQIFQMIIGITFLISANHMAVAGSDDFSWDQPNQQILEMLRGEGIQLPYCETWHANPPSPQTDDNFPTQYQQPESYDQPHMSAPTQLATDDGLGFARDAIHEANIYIKQNQARWNQERAAQGLPQLSGNPTHDQIMMLQERTSRDINMANKIGRGEATEEETAAFNRRMNHDIATGNAQVARDRGMLNYQKGSQAQDYRKESTNDAMQAGQSPTRFDNPLEPAYWQDQADQYDQAAKELLRNKKGN